MIPTKQQARDALKFVCEESSPGLTPQLAAISVYINANEEPFDFIANALRTKSDKFYGNKVTLYELKCTLLWCIESLRHLDRIKKALFYGKPFTHIYQEGETSERVADLPERIGRTVGNDEAAIDLLHGIIGKATEAGEMLEQLLAVAEGSAEFDPVNCKEETFDSQWYDAVICNALGVTFEEGQRNIIEKLRARFPDKFTEQSANVRDLEAERKVLETKFTATGKTLGAAFVVPATSPPGQFVPPTPAIRTHTEDMHEDKTFLQWIHNRLTHLHGENPNVDYMRRLQKIVNATPNEQSSR